MRLIQEMSDIVIGIIHRRTKELKHLQEMSLETSLGSKIDNVEETFSNDYSAYK